MTVDGIPFAAVPLLASLRKDDRDALAPLCRLHDYEKHDFVFYEGDAADRIHFVVTGRVKIVKAAGVRDVIIEILGNGEPVGAVAVFERRPFPARAIPLGPPGFLWLPDRGSF